MRTRPQRQMHMRNVAPTRFWVKVVASHGGGVHEVECSQCETKHVVHSSNLPRQCPKCGKHWKYMSDARLGGF